MAEAITNVSFKDLGPVNPAQTDRLTGEVWLNSRLQHSYPVSYWEFILAHEEGHIKGNNKSEFVADVYASNKFFAAHPNTPFLSVDALAKVLPMNNAEQRERVKLQKARAAKFDCNYNGNQTSCDMKVNYTGDNNEPMNTGAHFIEALKLVKANSNLSNYCNLDCLEQRTKDTKDKATAAQLQAAQDTAAALIHQADLDYQKAMVTLNALGKNQQSQEAIARLQYDLELQKLEAGKKQPIDSKKLMMVGLIAAAAIAILLFVNTSEA